MWLTFFPSSFHSWNMARTRSSSVEMLWKRMFPLYCWPDWRQKVHGLLWDSVQMRFWHNFMDPWDWTKLGIRTWVSLLELLGNKLFTWYALFCTFIVLVASLGCRSVVLSKCPPLLNFLLIFVVFPWPFYRKWFQNYHLYAFCQQLCWKSVYWNTQLMAKIGAKKE